jgi:D-glycero-D-manno-heptose 1,7-bisphosphate phosphatase
MPRAIFLDRDGTLIAEKGFICHFEQVELFDFAAEALRLFHSCGFLVVVITNQSAVARGICREQDVLRLHEELQRYYLSCGAPLDAFYCCPYLEDAPLQQYRHADFGRKPAPGMLLQAAHELGIDLHASFMIGDGTRDILAGKSAGCRTILVRTGKGEESLPELARQGNAPDLVADNLLAAAQWIAQLKPQ